MQEKLEFYDETNNDLIKAHTYSGKYDDEYVKKQFNVKVVSKDHKYEGYESATLQEAIDYVSKLDIVSVDIETTRKYNGEKSKLEGLDPYTSSIVMFQIGDLNTQFVIDTRTTDIQKLVNLLPNKIVVGHNLKFEYKHILHNYGVRLNKLYDTMLAEKVLFNGHMLRNGLKDLNQRYLGISVDKSIRMNFLSIKDRAYSNNEIEYGAQDIIYPLLIKEEQQEGIAIKNLAKTIDLECRFCKVLGEIEYKGLGFDQRQWLQVYDRNKMYYNAYEEALSNWVIENKVEKFIKSQLDMFDENQKCLIKWTSSKQVIELFRHLGICPVEKSKTTKKMAYTVEAKVLRNSFNNINKHIGQQNEKLILLYLEFKEFEQKCTTFGKDFLKNVNPITGRLHSDYNQIINTGRISSRGPNLQNIPSDSLFRKCFNCPSDSNIINADYSGQESVVLANASGDKNMIDFYLQGDGDLHSYVATRMFRVINNDPDLVVPPKELKDGSYNPDFTKDHNTMRSAAKAINFKIAYGGSAYTLKDDFKVDEETAQRFIDTYFDAFPGLRQYFSQSKKTALKNGYIDVDSITNRKYFFKDINKLPGLKAEKNWKEYFYLKGKYERASVNYKIQGTAGSITKRAGILFYEWLLDNNLFGNIDITNVIHDEINVEAKKGLAKMGAAALERCMEDAAKPWCTVVPLSAGAVITDHWTH